MRNSKVTRFATTSQTGSVTIKILLSLRPGGSEELREQKGDCAGYRGHLPLDYDAIEVSHDGDNSSQCHQG